MTLSENNADRPEPEAEHFISDVETLKVYFDPMRMKIIQAIAGQPRSVHEIADELDVPFTRLYYHVNMLERHGLIRVVETRNLSGAVEEKYYQVSARMFVIDRKLLTVGPTEGDGLHTFLEQVFGGTYRDIINSVEKGLVDINVRPPDPNSILIRQSVSRMQPERIEEFSRRLLELAREFDDARGEPGEPYYALTLSLYRSDLAMAPESTDTEASTADKDD